MSLLGALVGGVIGGFGKKPKVPSLPALDAAGIQTKTIADNLSSLPQAEALGAKVNAFNFAQAQNRFTQAAEFLSPGGLGKIQASTSSLLSGELPQDVARSILRSGAARALASGTPGSNFSRNASLRDLGLNSLQAQQMDFNQFSALQQMLPMPQLFDPSSMFYTPSQRLSAAAQQQGLQFQRDSMAAQVAAAPNPFTAALSKEADRFLGGFESAAGGALAKKAFPSFFS